MKEYVKPTYEYVELRPEERLAGSPSQCIIKAFCEGSVKKRSCYNTNSVVFK